MSVKRGEASATQPHDALHTITSRAGNSQGRKRQDGCCTCEVVEAVLLEHLEHQREELPHLRGHLLTRQAVGQREDLLVELWESRHILE